MANITRLDPFAELGSVQDRFNQLFNQPFFGNFGRMLVPEQGSGFTQFIPPVDIYEDEHNITLQAELPGIEEKDLDIRVDNNILTISGERKLENEENRENFHRIERSFGRFTRSFTLPPTVDTEHVNAEFVNGVLRIALPKTEAAKPKQIKIGVGKTVTPAKTKEKAA